MVLLPLLDTPTMMVMVAAGTLSMAIAMSVVRPERREGLGLWALALVAHTVTYVLFLLREQTADWISVVLANTVLALVFALLLGAVAEFHGRALPRLRMALPIVATAALMALFLKNYQGRLLSSSFMLALQIALVLWALWRPAAPAQLRGALLVSVALGAQGLILLGRGLWHGINGAPQGGFIGNGAGQSITFLSAFVVVLLASLGFILMTKDRADATNRHLALHDDLTGLANRRLLLQTLARDVARAIRARQPYALLMLDVDHFKAINDTYGHAAGDAVLQHMAGLLRQRLRAQDLAGRWGGEEFLLLLPGTADSGGQIAAEKLRQLVAQSPCAYQGKSIAFTISIGRCTESLEPGDQPEHLIATADKALYAAKRGGRNRVESAPLSRMHALVGALPAPARSFHQASPAPPPSRHDHF